MLLRLDLLLNLSSSSFCWLLLSDVVINNKSTCRNRIKWQYFLNYYIANDVLVKKEGMFLLNSRQWSNQLSERHLKYKIHININLLTIQTLISLKYPSNGNYLTRTIITTSNNKSERLERARVREFRIWQFRVEVFCILRMILWFI